jgi:dephospho-CoA kinase
VKFIGLTGGIGSGKSTVGSGLVARGAVVFDVDQVSRELQDPGRPFHEAIVARWGSKVVTADGELDRPKLARIVFNDQQQLKELTTIAGPFTEKEVGRRVSEHIGSNHVVVVQSAMYPAPMYGMTGLAVVDAPVEIAIARLICQRGMSEEDAQARVASQASRQDRLKRAGFVIDNSGGAADLQPQVDALFAWAQAQPDATPTIRRY